MSTITTQSAPVLSFEDLVYETESTVDEYTDPEGVNLTEKLVNVFFWLPVFLVSFLTVAAVCGAVFLGLYGVDLARAALYAAAWWTSTF